MTEKSELQSKAEQVLLLKCSMVVNSEVFETKIIKFMGKGSFIHGLRAYSHQTKAIAKRSKNKQKRSKKISLPFSFLFDGNCLNLKQ